MRARPATGRRLLAVVLLALLAVLGSARPAAAHAELVSSTPSDGAVLAEAPSTVELRFSESVGLVEGAIRLLTTDADPTPLSATATDATVTVELPPLPTDATYAVAYRVVSADGHPVSGVVTFSVGDAAPGAPPVTASATPAATELLVRVLSGVFYLGLLAFAGLVFCARVVLRGPGGTVGALVQAERWTLGAACLASALLVPASGLRVVGAGPGALLDPGAWAPGVSTMVALVPLAVAVLGWSAHLLGRRSGEFTPRDAQSVLLAAVAALAPAAVGHTLAFNPPAMLLADAGHLLGGAFWLGGLLAMLLFFHARPEKREMRAALARFSRWALWAVALIVVTGTAMGTMVLGSVENLLGTGYGRLLLVKVMVVFAALALAAWVRFRMLPTSRSRPKFFRALRHEAALLVGAVLLTGFLANTSPSHGHDHGPQQVAVESQGLTVEGVLSPGAVGTNSFAFTLAVDGTAPAPEEVEVSFRMPEQDLGPVPAEVVAEDDGSWVATVHLPVAGAWKVQVAARTSKYERPIAVFDVRIG
ncbi:CopD family protein [Tessaracoccus terricola]